MNARQKHLRLELRTTWFFGWLLFLGSMALFLASLFLWDWRYLVAGLIVAVGQEAAAKNERRVLDMLDC